MIKDYALSMLLSIFEAIFQIAKHKKNFQSNPLVCRTYSANLISWQNTKYLKFLLKYIISISVWTFENFTMHYYGHDRMQVHIFQYIPVYRLNTKGVLKNFAKFTGKHLCKSLFFEKVTGLRPATLLTKRLWHWCFPLNVAKFLRTPFCIELLRWLLRKNQRRIQNFFKHLR